MNITTITIRSTHYQKGTKMKEFDKVVGYKSVKLELERIIDMMINPDNYRSLGVKTTRGLLLYGEPGVGKTLMSKCFIEASKRKTFTLRKDTPDGDFVKMIKKTFDSAKEAAPSIVFLDDMDKFANEDSDHEDTEEYVTIQACIDDVKDYEVFVIATANNICKLPKSLLRAGRFDKNIEIENPKGEDVGEIVKYYLNSKVLSDDIDYKEIARLLDGKSCAALETVINEAGVYAGFEKHESISMNDIVRAFMRVVYDAPEAESYNYGKHLHSIAVHEAGHALVSEVLEPGSVTLATVKKHDGGSTGGFVSYQNDDDYFESMSYMENRVRACLAGKAATEVVYGQIDVGANSDLHRAFSIVGRFVDSYCGYGFGFWEGETDREESQVVANRKAQLIQTEMERYYQQTKRIIIENREFLDRLTEALVARKVLVYKDIQNIKAGCTIKGASC